jgi:phosphoesterase RecJ-like protein
MTRSPREHTTVRRTILRALDGPGPFLLTGHVRADGDFLGAALGLAKWLRDRGRSAAVVSTDGVPDPYGFLTGAAAVEAEFPPDISGHTAVILDTPSAERTGAPAGYFDSASVLVNIDHHPDNGGFGHAAYVDPSASSAALMVFEVLEESSAPIDEAVATALYTGIFTDTGGFRFANTDARTLRAAAELVALGAPPARVARTVYGSLSPAELRLLGLVLASAESALDGRVAILSVTDEMRAQARTVEDGIEGLASYGQNLDGADVAVLLREQGRSVRASLRSGGGLDVGAVARELGGGGHGAAAGVVLEGPIARAREEIVSAVRKRFGWESEWTGS